MSDKDIIDIERRQPAQSEQRPEFPANWGITADYDPNDHLINLKGKEYLNVQNRMLWFIRDQRAFTVAGLAQVPYIVRTELVEIDRADSSGGYAHFKTYVRDVLGNEATMYGSETARDFGDYAEKASTKSLGRALLALGYGTAFAPEMDEGERVVDAPVETKRQANGVPPQQPQATVHTPAATSAPAANVPSAVADQPWTDQQQVSIRKLCSVLGKSEPENKLTYGEARQLISQLSGEYQRARRGEDAGDGAAAQKAPPVPNWATLMGMAKSAHLIPDDESWGRLLEQLTGKTDPQKYTPADRARVHEHILEKMREAERATFGEGRARP